MDIAQKIGEKLAELGPSFQLGMDVPRTWASGVQAFINGDQTLLVFREQNIIPVVGDVDVILKNVTSVILPTNVAREFHTNLGNALGQLDAMESDASGND